MLMQIDIQNFITIEKVSLTFFPNTTVLTGETGTGKSILLDAIEIALGGRAAEHMIRAGQEKADISLYFCTEKLPHAHAWLKSYDLDQASSECIIRRVITKDGRSRSFINGIPTTLQPLRELAELLINIHGQYEQQSLLQANKQRNLLDHYAKHPHLVDQVAHLAEQYHLVQTELMALKKSAAEREQRSEFFKFQLRELSEVNISSNEFEQLDTEHKQLTHADELLQNLNLALNYLSDADVNILQLINRTLHALEVIQNVDSQISPWIEQLKSIVIVLTDLESEMQRYLGNIELDPQRLADTEHRLSLLFNLARKHKVSPNELFEFQQKLTAELKQLEGSDERIVLLAKQLVALEEQYTQAAEQLSQSRQAAAKKLAKEITQTIRALALPYAQFQIECFRESLPHFSPHGLEKIIFQIKTNPDHPLQPLAKVVSGGELSRVSLAIHMATAEQYTIPTLIFDEVDVGISGATAEIVGKLLRQLGNNHQVLCITHLPQVACQGHQHLRVEKIISSHLTYTQIKSLTPLERVQEIARMLGGVEITARTLAHAEEMLEGCY